MTELPDEALVTMRWVRENYVPKATGEARDMTTVECSEDFGHSPDWWQDRARKGEIPGAYQSGHKAPWYIPRQAATLFLREYRTRRRGKQLGQEREGWKAKDSRAGRPQAIQAGPVVGRGSKALGRRSADAA